MPTDKSTVHAAAWARAKLEGLEVTGDLFGQSHRFRHGSREVKVSIPSASFGPDGRPIGRSEKVASFRSGFVHDKRIEVTGYEPSFVEVAVTLKERLTIPTRMLQVSPKRPEIAGPTLTKRLDQLSVEYESRIVAALEYWEQAVRWISGSSSLGTESARAGRAASTRLSFTSLVQVDDGHRFWAPTQVISILGRSKIDAVIWEAVGAALSAGNRPPIWFRYADEGYHRFIRWDFTGAVLSSAIACETLARECFWMASGATGHPAARELIDRVPVRAILARWQSLTGVSKSASCIKEIGRIFDLRNRLMHAGGEGAEIEKVGIEKMLKAVRMFVNTGDEWYFRAQQLPNPRVNHQALMS